MGGRRRPVAHVGVLALAAEAKLPQGSIVVRIGPFPAASTCDGVFALTPGTYLLMDDITTLKPSGDVVSNAANGMVSQITVK